MIASIRNVARIRLPERTGWVTSFGEVLALGGEGTGSWGAGLCRYLRAHELNVIRLKPSASYASPAPVR